MAMAKFVLQWFPFFLFVKPARATYGRAAYAWGSIILDIGAPMLVS